MRRPLSVVLVLFLFTAPAVVLCLPFKIYNQRQDGELNVHAQLDNFIIVLVPTSGISWDIAGKASRPFKQGNAGNLLQIFSRTPPSTSPYKVDIDKSNVPLDKVSEDAPTIDNETFDPQIRVDNVQPVIAQPQNAWTGGNTNNNEVTKQNSPPPVEDTKQSDDNDEEKKKAPEEPEKVQENENDNKKTEDSTKDSKLAFSSTVNAQLDLTPEKKTPEVPLPPKIFPIPQQQEPENVITGKAVSAAVKNARFLNAGGDRRVKILQSGLEVCAPGQRLTARGQCVDMTNTRQR